MRVTAKRMSKLTRRGQKRKNRKILKEIFYKIREAAFHGETSVVLDGRPEYSLFLRAYLMDLGFDVDSLDYGRNYRISWGKQKDGKCEKI